MPFVTQERRKQLENFSVETHSDLLPLAPGDRCYLYYKEMVAKWKANPRWTTAHELYKVVRKTMTDERVEDFPTDDLVALELAWQVFFQLYVMPYELKKREENGDI